MKIKLPSETVFHTIESTIKDYRRFAQQNISEAIPEITIDQGLTLLFLNEHPDMTQKEIAELVFKDNASMTRMIQTMVNKNFIKRSLNSSDRRRFKLEITKKGREVLEIILKTILTDSIFFDMKIHLSKDQTSFHTHLSD